MYDTTKSMLLSVAIPKQTNTYKPISHGELITLSQKEIAKSGFIIDKELYSCSREGQQANGRYTISNVNDREMSLMIGWQNSYDKSLSLKFAIGGHIFICSNGAVVGDMGTFKRKHTGDVQEFTPERIVEYIKAAGDVFQSLQNSRDRMKEIETSKRICAELVGRMFIEEEIITATQLGIIKREIEKPSFDYGCDGSMWQLYNHTTHALKETHPSLYFEQHMKVHNFLTNQYA